MINRYKTGKKKVCTIPVTDHIANPGKMVDSDSTLNECRTIFEGKSEHTHALRKREDGYYEDRDTEAAWCGWRSAWQYLTEVEPREIPSGTSINEEAYKFAQGGTHWRERHDYEDLREFLQNYLEAAKPREIPVFDKAEILAVIERAEREGSKLYSAQSNCWANCARYIYDALRPYLKHEAQPEKCNGEKLLAWLDDPNRLPAHRSFTDGLERQIAYRFEGVLSKHKAQPSYEEVIEHFEMLYKNYGLAPDEELTEGAKDLKAKILAVFSKHEPKYLGVEHFTPEQKLAYDIGYKHGEADTKQERESSSQGILDGWQPIDTCPKVPNQSYLVWYPVSVYGEPSGMFGAFHYRKGEWINTFTNNPPVYAITHWYDVSPTPKKHQIEGQ